MHEVAEFGVAAHWGYKQKVNPNLQESHEFRWIKELLEILNNTPNPEEFLENTKLAMYYDRVFCFTPKGELIALPRGATALDFAFELHTDIGLNCIGARVNGRVAPLKTPLENGDQVEIFKSKSPAVMAAWEKFVTTGKAKSEIRKFLRIKQKEEYYHLGRSLIMRAANSIGSEYNDQIMNQLSGLFKRQSVEDLIIDVGAGVITRNEMIQALNIKPVIDSTSSADNVTPLHPLSLLKFKAKKKSIAPKETAPLPIQGLTPGLAVHFANCCCPIPGDRIVGIMHPGRGVNIHVVDCEQVHNFTGDSESQIVDVQWGNNDSEPLTLISRITVILANELGSLARLAHAIAEHGVNIQNIKIISRSMDFFDLRLDIEVRGISQLKGLLIGLKALDCVHSAKRCKE
jgi:GTP pyrophosphokinase